MPKSKIKVAVDEDIVAAAEVVKEAEKRSTKKPERKTMNLPKARLITGLLVIVILALIGWNIKISRDKANLNERIQQIIANPQQLVDDQNNQLIQRVDALIDLPQGETPTIATVSDATKAKQQSNFFANAQDGDKLLQYAQANKLILYRPSINKVIEVAPLRDNTKP